MTTTLTGVVQCERCIKGDMAHLDDYCVVTHTPWKNCGVECCIEEEDNGQEA